MESKYDLRLFSFAVTGELYYWKPVCLTTQEKKLGILQRNTTVYYCSNNYTAVLHYFAPTDIAVILNAANI